MNGFFQLNHTKRSALIALAALGLCAGLTANAQEKREWGKWDKWGDIGYGLYLNPIIPSDYSDLDCIRVGDDYYAITSTFQFSPGMTIIHSKDLVNWRIAGNAVPDLTQIGEALNWTKMDRPARGIWAGTLRYHDGRFYLFFGTPDEGYFMTTAPRPEGPWEPLTCLLAENGWDDCTAMWDENGEACFVGTCFKDNYKTYMFPMTPDGKKIDRSRGVLLNEGSGREASKLIRHGDWYYLVFSEHRNGVGRYVMAKRSKSMKGPYTEEKQLAHASTDANEPNQGGIIEGRDGKWYFLTHHGSGDWSGRIVSLLPVTWIDGWPIIGTLQRDGMGTMTWGGKIPVADNVPQDAPGEKFFLQRSDDFEKRELGPQWQWNYQPRKEFFSLDARPGWLVLNAFKPLEKNKLLKAGNTLTQRSFRQAENEVTVKMDISNMKNGQKAGLCHFSGSHSAIGVVKEGGKTYLEFRHNDRVERGPELHPAFRQKEAGQDVVKTIREPMLIWFRSTWGLDGESHYSYSLDGELFKPFGRPYRLEWGNYRGDRIGIYTFNDDADEGFVSVDYFHYR
ncbi:MAG: glycoside hydrolase 43 family protein [Lentisphaeria bacterium]|nr:glycoside hydrolase 43 family protein [Lentisphaeria bacterium]